MRPFEIAIVGLVLLGLVAARVFSRRSGALLLSWLCCGLLALTVALHLLLEGAHWQLGPLYLAVLVTVILLLIHDLGRELKIAAALIVILLITASGGLAFLKPMFKLPEPTGQYAVGTRIIEMTDASRREDAVAGDQHPREMVVQVWYPVSREAESSGHGHAPYRRLNETTWKNSHLSVVWTNARGDAPVAKGEFPILIYNPGWNGSRSQNTTLTEELASHGYVVVAIDHPYNSGPVQVADGRVIQPVPTPQLSDEVTTAQAVYALIDAEVAKETTDAQFVLAQMERMNEDAASAFYQRLDRSRIGALGYSLGGAVAAELALRDARIGAVLDLDTPLYGQAGKQGVRQPFLLLSEEIPHSTPEELARMSFGQRRDAEMDEGDYARQLPLLRTAGSYQIALHGTLHTSFQDGILMSPLQRFSGAGAIAPRRMISILRQYTVAFFDQSLRGVASPLLAAKTSPFPEAEVLYSADAAVGLRGK